MPKFNKIERLCRRSDIDQLFSSGYSFFKYPLKLIWRPCNWDNNISVKVVISVSKHKFKRAVDRNKIKRLVRESFRLNKFVLEDGLKGQKIHLAIVFVGKEIPDFATVDQIINEMFKRLIVEHEKLAG